MGKTTSAERMRKFRQKLKERPDELTNHLQRERERDKKRRDVQKQKFKNCKRLLSENRRKEAERKRKYREKIKQDQSVHTDQTDDSASTLGTYSCVQTLGKAVKKVKKILPSSPGKKLAVIRKLIFDNFDNTLRLLSGPPKKKTVMHTLCDEDLQTIINFYQRDDVSRQSPGIKDVKSCKNINTGEKILCQKRYMSMTVREAYALFVDEHPNINVKISKFYELRPTFVLLTSQMPHNVCVCKYHANFNYLVESIAKKVPMFPTTGSNLLEKCCCNVNSELCMIGDCTVCMADLHGLLAEINLYELCSWKKWIDMEGRPNLVTVEGTIKEAILELNQQLNRFKTHVFVKRLQSNIFNEVKCYVGSDEAILQIDFAENYAVTSQDEIQSAHWSHKQITVFTGCVWLAGEKKCSFALVSDVLRHDKYAVFASLKKIIAILKNKVPELKCIKIFSDGAASQFKNKFTLSNLCYMPVDFGVQGEWYFFATSHGKGAVDGVGAVVKRAVWSQVKQRKAEISNAADFVSSAMKIVKNINIMELTEAEVNMNKEELDRRWKLALPIPKIQSQHYFKAASQENLVTSLTYKSNTIICKAFKLCVEQVYSESESDWDELDNEPLSSLLNRY